MVDVSPPDLTTNVGMVRVLMNDTVAPYKYFSDNEILAMLGLFIASPASAPLRCAALIYNQVAASEVLLLKSFTTDDLAVNGDKVSAELRQAATALSARADAIDAIDNGDFFDDAPGRSGYPWIIEGLGIYNTVGIPWPQPWPWGPYDGQYDYPGALPLA